MVRSRTSSLACFVWLALLCVPLASAAQDGPPPTPCCCPPEPSGPAIVGQLILDDGAPTPIGGFSFGGTQQGTPGSGGGGGGGRFVTSDFQVVKLPDQLTTALLEAAFTGRRFRTVVIRLFANGSDETPLAEYRLTDVFVSAMHTGATEAGTTENVSFQAGRFRVTITPPGGGTYTFGWDFRRNTRL